jgi:hypothetical protein
MIGNDVLGRGGGEDGPGNQSNSALGALPSTGFLGGGGGGAFQLPNGLTRQDSFGTGMGGAMGLHPMFRQDSFARLNAHLAFSGEGFSRQSSMGKINPLGTRSEKSSVQRL